MKLFRSLVLGATAGLFVGPAVAQSTDRPENPSRDVVQSQTEINALYQTFLDTYQTDPTAAFKAASEYLRRHLQENLQTIYLRKWVNEYVAVIKKERKIVLQNCMGAGKFAEGFALGKEILASDPEEVGTLYILIDGGIAALTAGNNQFNAEASNYAKSALRLIVSGRTPDDNGTTRGKLNFALGIFNKVSAPVESAIYIAKALQFENFKTDPMAYSILADAILGSQYLPLYRDCKLRYTSPAQRVSAEAKSARARLDFIADQIIDALARAVALAGSEPGLAQKKALWMETLTQLYEYRNSGYSTGLTEFIEGILNKPLLAWVPQQ